MKRWLWIAGISLVIILLIGGAAFVLVGQSVSKDDPIPGEDLTAFPIITGQNLLFEDIEIPSGLADGPKLIVISYDVEQQPDVDEWLPPLEALNTNYPELSGYYVPLLPKSASDAALFIIGGMWAAAENDTDRARTIIVFTDVAEFNRLTAVLNEDQIQLFLLGEDNRIHWQAAGTYDEEKLDSLRTALETLRRESAD